jgi:hypothetical protein
VAGIAQHPVGLRIGQQAIEKGRGQAALRTLSTVVRLSIRRFRTEGLPRQA